MMRDAKLPEPQNTRVPAMWKIILGSGVDFKGKTVLDVGCGGADIAMRAYLAGADAVYAIDENRIELRRAQTRIQLAGLIGKPIYLMRKNADEWSKKWPGHHDIIICFSVLPYLQDPTIVLMGIYRDSDMALIECQYKGDGPGFDAIENDDDMEAWLRLIGWEHVTPIGKTDILGRDAHRTIWKCEK